MRWSAWPIVGVAWLLSAPAGHAALGGSMSSVEQDRAHFSAQMLSVTHATHAVHSMTLANGDTVREFMNPDGAVFAIAWRGPARPDLRQLLGARFDTLQSDNAAAKVKGLRRPLTVERSDFVVQSGGHPGAFWGLAYLPQAIPAGFSPDDLQMDTAP
jgi:hypothetical protein